MDVTKREVKTLKFSVELTMEEADLLSEICEQAKESMFLDNKGCQTEFAQKVSEMQVQFEQMYIDGMEFNRANNI